jgi:hypothetical protein
MLKTALISIPGELAASPKPRQNGKKQRFHQIKLT